MPHPDPLRTMLKSIVFSLEVFFFDIGFDKGIRQIFNLLEILLFIFFFEKYGSERSIELKVGYYLSEEENFRPLWKRIFLHRLS